MNHPPIRVLVVDDTVTYRKIIMTLLADMPGVEVVGSASNGKIALDKIELFRPDVITLDLDMPVLDGLEVLRRLRSANSPVGAIVLSAMTDGAAKATVTALNLGAFDFVLKPVGDDVAENAEEIRRKLSSKIRAFALTERTRLAALDQPREPQTRSVESKREEDVPPKVSPIISTTARHAQVIVVGISTGGPAALTKVLPRLPADLAAPILIVQHMPPLFTESMARDLDGQCALSVAEAANGQPLCPGQVLLAPGGKQMKVAKREGNTIIRITEDPPENSCRPSVDYLFRSVAQIYGAASVGIIMTGMGNDGALGCRLLKRQGAKIIAQDEDSCVVYGMPSEPIEEGIVDIVAPLDEISNHIVRYAGRGAGTCA